MTTEIERLRQERPFAAAAADERERLQAELATAREALREIAADNYEPIGESFTEAAKVIASAALAKLEEK